MYGIRATCRAAAILFSFCLAATGALAQGIQVSPTNLLLAPGQTAASLSVTNPATQDFVSMQGYSGGSRVSGEDVLGPCRSSQPAVRQSSRAPIVVSLS
jgi:P pilus assembly chaperone PapD